MFRLSLVLNDDTIVLFLCFLASLVEILPRKNEMAKWTRSNTQVLSDTRVISWLIHRATHLPSIKLG